MKKRILSVLLAALLLFGILPAASAASGSLSNFTRVYTYQSGRFRDVASSHWYAAYVQAAYEYGLVNGRTATAFDPNGTLTVAEAVKLAVCLNSIYYTGSVPASNSVSDELWYRSYADAALAAGILDADHRAYNAPITRSEFAQILSKALPDEALSAINTVEDGAIPDVPMDLSYSGAVYKLYRAGVLTGSDANGRFLPDTTIKRSEVAAVVTRMADAAYRKSLTLKLSLTAAQIFEKCAPAVFYISIDDVRGKNVKTGSGFFISETGLAVTNYHVIVGAGAATITTLDGKKYPVSGLYGYDEGLDLALIQVEGAGFSYLELADSDSLAVGADVYAIGSPLGYQNTISAGIISGLGRQIDHMSYIQTTAAISSGSSGGALLDSSGKLIGVTTATAAGAQNINLAVPSNNILKVEKGDLVSLVDALPGTRYYDNLFPAPDFGAFAGISTYKTEKAEDDTFTYYYRVSDLNRKMTTEEAYEGYARLLQQNTFSLYGYALEEGQIYTYYINNPYNMLVTFGSKTVDGVECIRIQVISF
jgi:S1-C subfamily serine protease